MIPLTTYRLPTSCLTDVLSLRPTLPKCNHGSSGGQRRTRTFYRRDWVPPLNPTSQQIPNTNTTPQLEVVSPTLRGGQGARGLGGLRYPNTVLTTVSNPYLRGRRKTDCTPPERGRVSREGPTQGVSLVDLHGGWTTRDGPTRDVGEEFTPG